MAKHKIHRITPEMAQNMASIMLTYYELAVQKREEFKKTVNPTLDEKRSDLVNMHLIETIENIVKTAGKEAAPLNYSIHELLLM